MKTFQRTTNVAARRGLAMRVNCSAQSTTTSRSPAATGGVRYQSLKREECFEVAREGTTGTFDESHMSRLFPNVLARFKHGGLGVACIDFMVDLIECLIGRS